MNNELLHAWLKKGEQAEDHKYTSRVWKNGRWYYYYGDGTVTENYPKGQNYSTGVNAATIATQHLQKSTPKTITTYTASSKSDRISLSQTIKSGYDAVSKLEYFLESRLADIVQDIKRTGSLKSYPIGQNYSTIKKK